LLNAWFTQLFRGLNLVQIKLFLIIENILKIGSHSKTQIYEKKIIAIWKVGGCINKLTHNHLNNILKGQINFDQEFDMW
jgi:hypothetical protein